MRLLIYVSIMVGAAALGYRLAIERNRKPLLWTTVCFLFPILGILLLAQLSGPKKNAEIPAGHIPEVDKWQLLIDLDEDVRAAAEKARQLGPGYEKMLAGRYIGLGDKHLLAAALEFVTRKHDEDLARGVIGDT